MNTPYRRKAVMTDEALAKLGAPGVVYIREVSAADLRGVVEGVDEFPDDQTLYSVHAADGTRMAIMNDLEKAHSAAKRHEMQAVSVH